ncbi:peptide/nickel transport system substrate-binding protein [Dethiosulfatibacter aminovorans DSM 17477]|uniref:Peptide/nickel transport system substrate-binding protein n=1 Tax=Dethiosulfatibacter aminovorans DSM 17477 TaxID=1121476 RepID=A0A1M6C8G7_9FIRM|nr:DUF6305 family protein [Dethiosulfatibacter aminovorans]SHI57266.1 peptide/nickel transport system substrate-binding protein [Dethiosulfatibacter aminovorans DSM 17477]
MNGRNAVLIILICLVAFIAGCGHVVENSDVGKELIIGRYSDSISLDPAVETDRESFQVTVNIYETLVRTADNGIDILPGLAEEWEMSEDGLSFVFKLREDVVFHDGTLFDAEAVVFNFQRWMDEDNPYHVGEFRYWNQSFMGEKGLIRSVEAISKYEVKLLMNEPYAPLLGTLALPSFGIASPHALMKYNDDIGTNPVGTGPYSFESWVRGSEVVLERFDDYWGGVPDISKVIFRQLDRESDYVELLEKGEIHIIIQLSQEQVHMLEDSQDTEIHYSPFMNVSYIALNNEVEPFNDVRVRKAVSKLIDYDKMMKTAFDEFARPAATFLPPTILGYHEGLAFQEYDFAGARELLREAGLEEGFEAELWVMEQPRIYYPDPLKVAYYIKEQLHEGGIEVTVRSFPWEEYLEILREGKHQMALAGWSGDFADPDNFLYTLFFSENAERGTVLNYSFYSNDKVDHFLKQGRIIQDKEFRESIYRNILEILHDEVASIPLTHTISAMGINKQVKGFNYDISGYIEVFELDLVKGEKELLFSSLPRPIAEEMLLITSAGQNTDSYIIKDMADKQRIHHYFMPQVEEIKMDNVSSVAVVVGYSTIGMDLKDSSMEEELDRMDNLVKYIEQKDLTLISIVVNEQTLSNEETERLFSKVLPQSDYVIIMGSRGKSEEYIRMAQEHGIPVTLVEDVRGLNEAFVSAFR